MTTSSGEQNGRQPPLPGQISPTQRPLQDARFANQNAPPFGAKVHICRDFLCGTCTKTTQCKYRHELDFEEMKKVLRFCHDHQNRSGCIREDCTYLHVTKDEESLFLTSGQLPRLLAERHTNMTAASNTTETNPQIALFIKESFVNAPPPPPPPPPPTVPAPSPLYPDSSSCSSQQLPPPPPPPPPPSTSSVAPPLPSVVHPTMATSIPTPTPAPMSVPISRAVPGAFTQVTPPVYTGPPPTVMCPVNMPPPSLPPMFDASVPPPSLPSGIAGVQTTSGAMKRRMQNEAGPSKLRKAEEFRHEDELCANCLQLQLRMNACRHEVQQLEIEEEFHKIILQNKTTEYENIKYILSSLVRPEVSRLLEEHVEGVPHIQLHDILSGVNQASPVASSSLPSVMMILLECLLKNSRNPAPTLRTHDVLLPSIANLTRRNLSMPSSPNSVLDALSGLIRSSNTNCINGYSRYNGHKVEEKIAATSGVYANEQQQQLGRLRGDGLVAAAAAPPYPAGPLPPPPPARHYYTQPYAVPTNTSVPYYPNYRPPTPAYGARASVAAVPSANAASTASTNNGPYVVAGRYPAPPQ